VISKSTHRERIEENSLIFDFTLSAADMDVLDAPRQKPAAPIGHASKNGGELTADNL